MPTLRANAARDTVAPALHKAQDTVTSTVVPAVVSGLAVAKSKSGDLLDSDVAHEARRRGAAIVRAARGDLVPATPGRRWRFGIGMIGIGTGIGFLVAWLARRLSTPVESYTTGTSTLPVPSGTDGGTVTGNVTPVASADGAAPSGTPTNEINLSAGAPTNF
ncbi:MAG TPA: hypothetical protein VF519_02310 [Mycobacteriales bacterium]|jgi:hypothetical protein